MEFGLGGEAAESKQWIWQLIVTKTVWLLTGGQYVTKYDTK